VLDRALPERACTDWVPARNVRAPDTDCLSRVDLLVTIDVFYVWFCVFMYGSVRVSGDDDDDQFTPTKHLKPPPHHSSRLAAAHTDTETPLLHQKEG